MLTTDTIGENRQTYYTTSSQIDNNSGCVFLDAFTKSLSESAAGSNQSSSIASSQSILAIEIFTGESECLALSLDSNDYIDDPADPRADKFFDDPENIKSALSAEYQRLKDAGFTTAELSDEDISEMSKVFSRISAFSQYNNQDYYGENNSGRYKLESGVIVNVMHQEVVISEKYQTEEAGSTPQNWTADNSISDLPGFEQFKKFGFSNIIKLPQDTTVDDDPSDNTDGTGSSTGTGDTGSSGSADSSDKTSGSDSAAGEESPYHIEDDPVIKALFKLLTESPDGIGYGSAVEQDFKDLVIDFNQEMDKKESLEEKKKYFDSVIPYISEMTSLLEEPATVESIFKSVDVIFDAAFTSENYSILDTGSSEINQELFEMRGTIDTYLSRIKALKKEMDQYNEDNPLDAGSTETDPVWEAKLARMGELITDFFGDYGPEPVEDFISSKLIPQEAEDDTTETGPEDGVTGSLYKIISKNSNGIALDSVAQDTVRRALVTFESTIYGMKTDGYGIEQIKEEFDSAMPYINKALELLNDSDAILENLKRVNNTFKNTFLESNGSVPTTYDDDFRAAILKQRGGMNQAISSYEYYNQRVTSGLQNNEPQSLLNSYNTAMDTALDNFISASNVKSYSAALNQYRQENAAETE